MKALTQNCLQMLMKTPILLWQLLCLSFALNSCATSGVVDASINEGNPLGLLLTPFTLIADAGHMVSGGALDDEFTESAWIGHNTGGGNASYTPQSAPVYTPTPASSFSSPASPTPASASSSPSVLTQPSVSSQKEGGRSWGQITPPHPCSQLNVNGEPGFYNPNPFTVKVLYVVRLKEGLVPRRTQPFESAIRGEVHIPAMKSVAISLGLNQRLHGDTIVGVVSYHTLR